MKRRQILSEDVSRSSGKATGSFNKQSVISTADGIANNEISSFSLRRRHMRSYQTGFGSQTGEYVFQKLLWLRIVKNTSTGSS